MAKYKCDRCGYQTNRTSDYKNHENRKIPCRIGKKNDNTKKFKLFYCKICKKIFKRDDILKKHLQKFHSDNNNNVIKTINKMKDNKKITNNVQVQNIIKNYVLNIPNNKIVEKIIWPFYHYDLSDLTLFEQYCILTSKSSIYTSILDHFNLNPKRPEYHNMRITNLNKKTMDVHDGNNWIELVIPQVMVKIVISYTWIISTLLTKFRILLNNKAIDLIPTAFFHCEPESASLRYVELIEHIRNHIYDKRDNNEEPICKIPKDRNHEIFWAISKNFNWSDVKKYVAMFNKYNIDFNADLEEIKEVLIFVKNKSKSKKFKKKIILRINNFIENYKNNVNQDSDSSKNLSDLSDSESSNYE